MMTLVMPGRCRAQASATAVGVVSRSAATFGRDLRKATEALANRAQRAGAVREDLRAAELWALLSAACLAAEHGHWSRQLRTRALAILFDGLRPHH
jgi:hypothetical protein